MADVTISYWFYIFLLVCFGYTVGNLAHFVWIVIKDIANG